MAQDEPQDAATEAFEALRAEVIQLRAGVESLSAGFQAQASPDYAPTLGAMAKSLVAIESHPALQMSPESFAHRLRAEGELSAQQGAHALGVAVQRVAAAGADLERLALGWRTGQDQVRQVAIMSAVGAVAGVLIWVCLSGPVARALPSGWYVPERMAAATLRQDRWNAGAQLMGSADSSAWNELAAASAFWRENAASLERCRKVAAKAKASQRCLVKVSATAGLKR